MGFADDMKQYKHGERGFEIKVQLWDNNASTYINVVLVASPVWQTTHGLDANPILKDASGITHESAWGSAAIGLSDISFSAHNNRINQNRSGEDRTSRFSS